MTTLELAKASMSSLWHAPNSRRSGRSAARNALTRSPNWPVLATAGYRGGVSITRMALAMDSTLLLEGFGNPCARAPGKGADGHGTGRAAAGSSAAGLA